MVMRTLMSSPSFSGSSTVTSVTGRWSASRDRGDSQVADRGSSGAEQHRRDVGDDLVDQARREERRGQRRAALEEHVLAVAREQVLQRRLGVAGAQVDGLGGVVEHPARRGRGRAPPSPHAAAAAAAGTPAASRTVRWGSSTATVLVPTSIVSHSARSRWVSSRAARLETQRLVPSAAALRPSSVVANFQVTNGRPCSTAKVQTRFSSSRLVGEKPCLDLHAGGAQRLGAADRHRVGVALGDDHSTYAGVDQRLGARAGTAGVVARLEGDHRGSATGGGPGTGERVDLGMRAAGAAVESFGDRPPARVEEHAADARVGSQRYAVARGQRESAAHRPTLSGQRWSR